MEVIRDKHNNVVITCSIENVDPMGVHTGDSITVAPTLTLTDKEYQNMRNASIAVLREIGLESGGSNVQFAINPKDGRLVVIEMNPRVSRSSALASKATGFPIAKVAAKLAIGYTLDEISYSIVKQGEIKENKSEENNKENNLERESATGNPEGEINKEASEKIHNETDNEAKGESSEDINEEADNEADEEANNDNVAAIPASFEPAIDYVVTKIPRFNFEKFADTQPLLSSSMRSVGEIMSIGRSFGESLQKGLCSLEKGLNGLNSPNTPQTVGPKEDQEKKRALLKALSQPTPDRIFIVAEALRQGISLEDIHNITLIDPWFLREIEKIIQIEDQIIEQGPPKDKNQWLYYKKMGFSDSRLAQLTQVPEAQLRKERQNLGIRPVYKSVDTCAGEFASSTFCLYSCYEGSAFSTPLCESLPSDRKKVIILGSGPNRIGQGIEFDYTCVHAAQGLSEMGYETIMVNCNPETVSTDYDSSDKLYFEPLSVEHILELVHCEQQNGSLLGVVVQLGGQTPLKLAPALQEAGIPILGTSPDSIDLAEDRDRFQKLLHQLGLRQPENSICRHIEDIASTIDKTTGYPVVIRPSHVLGGRAMKILREPSDLEKYLHENRQTLIEGPILIDRFLSPATEVDVDAICDGKEVYIAGIMEHVEPAGIHSGDSACVFPSFSLSEKIISEIKESTVKLAQALHVKGLVNIQYAVKDEELYVIEVNPRASRTTPFLAKATGLPLVKIAAQVTAGKSLGEFDLPPNPPSHYSVKETSLPFSRFPQADILLGPEMKSTGEAMGWDKDLNAAFAKAQLSVLNKLPTDPAIAIVAYNEGDKDRSLGTATQLKNLGFEVVFAEGLARISQQEPSQQEPSQQGFTTLEALLKREGKSLDELLQSGKVNFVACTNTSESLKDFRCSLVNHQIPYFTTHEAITLALSALPHSRPESLMVQSLQSITRK